MVDRLIKNLLKSKDFERVYYWTYRFICKEWDLYKLVTKCINKALYKKESHLYEVENKKLYVRIEYFNEKSMSFAWKISNIIGKYFGSIKIIPYLKKYRTLKIKSSHPLASTGYIAFDLVWKEVLLQERWKEVSFKRGLVKITFIDINSHYTCELLRNKT